MERENRAQQQAAEVTPIVVIASEAPEPAFTEPERPAELRPKKPAESWAERMFLLTEARRKSRGDD
jgi:hypothetical protein